MSGRRQNNQLQLAFEQEHRGEASNGLIEGMRPDTAFFDMSTN